jgi:hypothetical protein
LLFNFILGSGEDAQGIEFESTMVGATAGLTIARLGIQFSFNSEVKINSKIHNNLFRIIFSLGLQHNFLFAPSRLLTLGFRSPPVSFAQPN